MRRWQSVGLFDLHQSFVQGSVDRSADGLDYRTPGEASWCGVFLDEVDLQGGDRIPATIKANLRACDEFVILLSPESLARQWVIAEMGGAWILDKRIMVIRYDLAAESIPDILRHDKSYELNDFDRYVNELIGRRKGKG